MRKLLGFSAPDIRSAATDQWMLAEGTPVEVRPAKYLPGQIERIRGAEFGSVADVVRDFVGGFESRQPPTMAFQLRNAMLIDGVLYSGSAVRHLKPSTRRWMTRLEPNTISQAVLYESWPGNRWFGNWLSDDCLSYRLAEFIGWPVATQPAIGHKSAYERLLQISPVRLTSTRFDELILLDDRSHNENRRWRASDMRRRLVGAGPQRHAGVFLLRGQTGMRRVLLNERTIAEHLATRHGFRVIDPAHAPVRAIIDACAGARVVAGVEGSHLVHGLMVMPPEARALVIQPPDRAVSVLKLITDRQGQDYSFVVGVGSNEAFTACADEIDRTLDLV